MRKDLIDRTVRHVADVATVAAALALDGALVDRLRTEHVDDGQGRCAGCSVAGSVRVPPRWPCIIRDLADDAARGSTSSPRSTGGGER